MPKNIAIMIHNLTGGGAERVAGNLSLELPSKYNKFIFLFDAQNITYPYEGKIVKIKNNKTHNPISKGYEVFRKVMEIKKLKKKYNIDVSISHMGGMNFYNVLSRVNDKIIITEHSYIRKKGLSTRKKIFRKLYNKADKIISVSKGIEKNLIENYNIENKKTRTIYNFFDLENIKTMKDESLSEKSLFKNPIIINIGRLTKPKGQWHLIKIFSKVKKEIDDAKLVFLGEGPMQNKLENLSKKLGIEKDVIFLGFKDNPYKYINNSDIFAFTSLWEGLPMVIIEAMASNTPVISTDCKSGPREIIAPEINQEVSEVTYSKYGVLTPPFDQENFNFNQIELNKKERDYANALINFIKDSDLKSEYIKKQKERIKNFTPKNIIRDWEKIIDD